jgi:glycosyltransferase involved in cell wall biosynthesis
MPDSAEGLTFILPVFNQEKTLGRVVSAWLPVLNSLNRAYELLIVDDSSTDGTKGQAESLTAKNDRIKLLSLPEHKGFGSCLRLALESSTNPLVFYSSTDHAWQPSDLPRMMKSLDIKDEYSDSQVELVNGHRRGTVWSPRKQWLQRIHRCFMRIVFGFWPEPPRGNLGSTENKLWWRYRLLFGLRLGDMNSKFKLIRRSVLDKMELQSDGEFIHAEILAKANFLGCMMDEVALSDKEVPQPAPDVRKDMWRVFHNPRFRSPIVASPPPVEAEVASSA